jgi:hypothetical protein
MVRLTEYAMDGWMDGWMVYGQGGRCLTDAALIDVSCHIYGFPSCNAMKQRTIPSAMLQRVGGTGITNITGLIKVAL